MKSHLDGSCLCWRKFDSLYSNSILLSSPSRSITTASGKHSCLWIMPKTMTTPSSLTGSNKMGTPLLPRPRAWLWRPPAGLAQWRVVDTIRRELRLAPLTASTNFVVAASLSSLDPDYLPGHSPDL